MNIYEIHAAVLPRKKCSKASIYKYLHDLGIEPIGARQRPQRYPDDSASRILVHLGINGHSAEPKPPSMKMLRHQKRIHARAMGRAR